MTKKMLSDLQKARAIELSDSGRNICVADDFKSTLAGLYTRGLVNTKKATVDGKEVLAVYITCSGISFLNAYEADAKKLQHESNIRDKKVIEQ